MNELRPALRADLLISGCERRIMNSRILTRTFFKLVPLQILIVAIGSVNSIIDGVIASRLIGPMALAVTGLTIPCIKIVEAVNDVLSGGSEILCGRSLGANMLKKARGIFTLDVICVIVTSAVLSVCLFMLLPPAYVRLLRIDHDTAQGYYAYLKGFMPGVLPLMLSAQLSGFLQYEHKEKRAYCSMAAMFVTNAVLNIFFITRLNLGLFGLGLATSVSNWTACLILVTHYFSDRALVRFELSSADVRDLKEIVSIGLPGGVIKGYLALRSTIVNMIIIKHVGTDGLSAFSAIDAFGCIYFAATAGIGTATRLLVSVYYGEKDRTGLIEIMRIALKKGVLLVGLISAVLCALAVPFTRIYFHPSDGILYSMTKAGFMLFPLSCPLSCVLITAQNYYQCTGRIKIIHVLSFVDGFAGVCATAAVLVPRLGMNGLWIAQIMNGIYVLVILLLYSVINNHRFPRNIPEFLNIPKFGECYRLDFPITSEEDVVNISQIVIDFCSLHNICRKHAMYAGLCVEELAGNIVAHGFTDGKKHGIDLRLMIDSEGLLIRLKDDCRAFNPKEAGELFAPEDITHNIGLRLISRTVKSMEYQAVFGLNVLTIRI